MYRFLCLLTKIYKQIEYKDESFYTSTYKDIGNRGMNGFFMSSAKLIQGG